MFGEAAGKLYDASFIGYAQQGAANGGSGTIGHKGAHRVQVGV